MHTLDGNIFIGRPSINVYFFIALIGPFILLVFVKDAINGVSRLSPGIDETHCHGILILFENSD